ncbi:hypothetical protein [Sporosarcina sp. JAI121]|uniref:hypothetical protein n=1 Tax=Sporosarcina sp. JAI121 TaxID=2723064 RepID=UPI0015C880A5|nr:hypothetical protein [Sporosarcina sp. JAI121]NYF24285.1 hypothetical protein [Sporosarcina sp. JAI121]
MNKLSEGALTGVVGKVESARVDATGIRQADDVALFATVLDWLIPEHLALETRHRSHKTGGIP